MPTTRSRSHTPQPPPSPAHQPPPLLGRLPILPLLLQTLLAHSDTQTILALARVERSVGVWVEKGFYEDLRLEVVVGEGGGKKGGEREGWGLGRFWGVGVRQRGYVRKLTIRHPSDIPLPPATSSPPSSTTPSAEMIWTFLSTFPNLEELDISGTLIPFLPPKTGLPIAAPKPRGRGKKSSAEPLEDAHTPFTLPNLKKLSLRMLGPPSALDWKSRLLLQRKRDWRFPDAPRHAEPTLVRGRKGGKPSTSKVTLRREGLDFVDRLAEVCTGLEELSLAFVGVMGGEGGILGRFLKEQLPDEKAEEETNEEAKKKEEEEEEEEADNSMLVLNLRGIANEEQVRAIEYGRGVKRSRERDAEAARKLAEKKAKDSERLKGKELVKEKEKENHKEDPAKHSHPCDHQRRVLKRYCPGCDREVTAKPGNRKTTPVGKVLTRLALRSQAIQPKKGRAGKAICQAEGEESRDIPRDGKKLTWLKKLTFHMAEQYFPRLAAVVEGIVGRGEGCGLEELMVHGRESQMNWCMSMPSNEKPAFPEFPSLPKLKQLIFMIRRHHYPDNCYRHGQAHRQFSNLDFKEYLDHLALGSLPALKCFTVQCDFAEHIKECVTAKCPNTDTEGVRCPGGSVEGAVGDVMLVGEDGEGRWEGPVGLGYIWHAQMEPSKVPVDKFRALAKIALNNHLPTGSIRPYMVQVTRKSGLQAPGNAVADFHNVHFQRDMMLGLAIKGHIQIESECEGFDDFKYPSALWDPELLKDEQGDSFVTFPGYNVDDVYIGPQAHAPSAWTSPEAAAMLPQFLLAATTKQQKRLFQPFPYQIFGNADFHDTITAIVTAPRTGMIAMDEIQHHLANGLRRLGMPEFDFPGQEDEEEELPIFGRRQGRQGEQKMRQAQSRANVEELGEDLMDMDEDDEEEDDTLTGEEGDEGGGTGYGEIGSETDHQDSMEEVDDDMGSYETEDERSSMLFSDEEAPADEDDSTLGSENGQRGPRQRFYTAEDALDEFV